MTHTMTYDSLHYCVTCNDCGAKANYDGRMPEESNLECQHTNTSADYDCYCNPWTELSIYDLVNDWLNDPRYHRNHKRTYLIVGPDTTKEISQHQLKNGIVRQVAGNFSEFDQTWTLKGNSLTVVQKSVYGTVTMVIKSGRN